MNLAIEGWPLILIAVFASVYALLGIAYACVWLSVLWLALTDPPRYQRFRDLRQSRKGK